MQSLQAEQGLAAVALHVADLRKEVNQKQAELQAAERQKRVEAALCEQVPRLQRWQDMQVSAHASKPVAAVQCVSNDRNSPGKVQFCV